MKNWSPETLRALPNYVTYFRVAIIPIVIWLLLDPTPLERYFALTVFIIAALSDFVDGYLARKFGAVSDFGKLLDPLADKILVVAVLVMLTSLRTPIYGDPLVPGWLVVAVVAREIWATGLRGLAAQQGVIVAASSSAKWKTLIQLIAVGSLLLYDLPLTLFGWETTAQIFGLNLLLISLVFSYISVFEYTVRVLYATHESHKTEEKEDRINNELTH